MKKITSKQIKFHDLMNHLHQIQLICDTSSSSEILHQVNVLRQECEAAIDLASSIRELGDQGSAEEIYEYSGEDFSQYFIQYFNQRKIKTRIVPEKNINLYRVTAAKGIQSVLANIFQNLERYQEKSSEVEIRFKAVGEFVLVAIKNKKADRIYQDTLGVGLESVEDYCIQNGGKARFSQDSEYFYTRLFFPIKADCPAIALQAA